MILVRVDKAFCICDNNKADVENCTGDIDSNVSHFKRDWASDVAHIMFPMLVYYQLSPIPTEMYKETAFISYFLVVDR